MQDRLVFLIGSPRSGSTLLSRVLGAHSAIFAPEEPHLITPLAHLGYYDAVEEAPYDPVITRTAARALVAALPPPDRGAIRGAGLAVCVTCTDVHEYGKILVEAVLRRLGVRVVDAGVSVDPDAVVAQAMAGRADAIAVSTYSGVALYYLQALRREMVKAGLDLPVFIGGKLNQIVEDEDEEPEGDSGAPGGPSSRPVDVSDQLQDLGAVVCHQVEDMVGELLAMARERGR